MGERAQGVAGWSQWIYSDPTGIVASGLPSAAVINTAASVSPTGGVQVGDVLTITAPSITGATSWWVSWFRDGVGSEAIATDLDTFPFFYTVQPSDVCSSFILRTYASNANPAVPTADSAEVGPVIIGGSSSIIDLGSFSATASFIQTQGFSGNWALSGTATQTATVASASALKSLWDSSIRTGSTSERWDITLDWDGMTTVGTETNYLTLNGPSGSTGWSDNGGWVRLKAATGKRPAFANCIQAQNWRGVHLEGLDLFGRNSSQYAGLLYLDPSYPECRITGHNLRFGRYCIDQAEPYTEMLRGIYTGGDTNGEVTLDKVLMAGCFVPAHGGFRSFKMTNFDVQMTIEDILKLYTNTKSGYYAYTWLRYGTIRRMFDTPATRTYHADLVQYGALSDRHSGNRLYMEDVIAHMDHQYGNVNGKDGGTQGLQIGNQSTADNLLALRNVIILHTSPNSVIFFSPQASYTSYIENVTTMRAGISPSGFDGYLDYKDQSPGFNTVTPTPVRSGVAFRVRNSLSCKGAAKSWAVFDSSCFVGIKPNIGAATGRPETVFNGRDFERGGALTANSIADKFGYILPNEGGTQAQFIADIFANFTPQGVYGGKGCQVLDPSNFTAPTLG